MLAAAAVAALSLVLPWSLEGVATMSVIAVAALTGAVGWSARARLRPDRSTVAGVAVWALSFISVAAFLALPTAVPSDPSMFSIPAERVETPRVPGLPSDSHLPYRTGQLVLHELGGEALRDGFHPGWWVSDRGPLPGLVFAFGAAALRVDVPPEDPITLGSDTNVMQFMDPFGYWLYLLISAAASTASVLGVYALGARWLGRRPALVGSVLFCLLPGVFLYSIYPRPALVFVLPALLALVLVGERRFALAGVAVASCYLAHPTGAVWGLAALALLWLSTRSVRLMLPSALRLLAPAALLALPWTLFTSQVVGGTSRMLVWPLGAKLTDPTRPLAGVADAAQGLVDRGLWEVPWVRGIAVVRSVVPMELIDLPDNAPRAWVGLHSVGAWGIIGLLAFPLALVAVAKLPRVVRTQVLVVAGVTVGLNIVIEGYPEAFFPQSLLPLAGVLAIALAAWALSWTKGWRVALLAAVVAEYATLVWASSLYQPFGTDTEIVAVFTVIAVIAQLCLVAIGVKGLVRTATAAPSDSPPSGRIVHHG